MNPCGTVRSLRGRLLVTGFAALSFSGCSLKSLTVRQVSDALAESPSSFASDDDPELVREAIPFGLKTMESLLEASPRHQGLLSAASSGFFQYAFAFLQQDADFAEASDLRRATALRDRARRLYLRGRDYGLRGLEVDFPGFREEVQRDPRAALLPMKKEHLRLLYWTAVSWASAMALAVNDSALAADQDIPAAMMKRALALDEGFELGAIHDFFISFEAGRRAAGGSMDEARAHFERALALAGGRRAWPYVRYAESVAVAQQDRKAFGRLLNEALAVDPAREKSQRLSNLIAQQRARWLLGRADELFVE
jgi:predicted anti-sigma-YlaC factor YlaD